MTETTPDVAGAIAALSAAVNSMEQRQVELATQLSAAKQRRRERLDQRVAMLLPDISDATMTGLKREVPSFAADRKVIAAFEQNKKILGLFKRSGYDTTLSLLQAQLKLYSERQGVASDEVRDTEQLESESATLATQLSEALEMLRLLEKAHRTDMPLPPEAVSSINSLSERGRGIGRPGYSRSDYLLRGGSRFDSNQAHTVPPSGESNFDLWLWMMTDIPTSFRTLMLNSFSHHHDSKPSHLTDNSIAPSASALGAVDASNAITTSDTLPVPEGQASIATDDRLGAFS